MPRRGSPARRERRQLGAVAEQLAQAHGTQEAGVLAAGVCHELGNGLSCVHGYAEMLLEEEGLPRRVREGLRSIAAQSARCAALIDDLRRLAHPPADAAEVFPLAQPLGAVLRLCRYELKKERVALVADLAAGALVRGDRGRLQQVFLNLVRNSIEAMSESPEKRLAASISIEGGRVRARLADTGRGLGPEGQRRLFEPFFTTKGRAGTGLGLYLSRQIARRHGGQLTIEGEPGRGATACLDLPAAQ